MILLRFFAGMILNTGIVLLSAVLGEIDVRCFYYILSISIAMMIQGTDITLIYNRANGFYRNDTMISIMTMMLTSLFKFIIVHYRLSFALLSIPIIFEALIPALYRQCSANAIKARFVIKKKIALYLIKHSVSYLFPSLSMLINQRAVFFILGIFNGQYLVGVYSVAFFISNAIFMLPNIITMTSLVKLNKISDYTERAEKAISTIRLITLLSLLIIVVSHFCGEYMIPKFLGEGYEKLNDIVTLIIFSFYVASVGVLSIKTLSKEECEGYYSVKYTLIIVLNIVLTVVLSLKYGIIGATCGFLFTEILSSTIANYLISKKIFYLHLKLFFNRS
ncbi:hypothetical protein [Enterobacter sp. 638]|nr:hypothetical protein [Enterobacter sp. 638]